MEYLVVFLEGIITFISPCMLPMLPVYLSYFSGKDDKKGKSLIGALGFVLGFTIIFVSLGAFATTVGSMLIKYQDTVNLVTGAIVVLFGLGYVGLFEIKFLNMNMKAKKTRNVFETVMFGMIFAIGWTPCVGTFLGSALMLASTSGSIVKGSLMLLVYSIGLGIPFVVSAILIEELKGTFNFIKKHFGVIKIISGVFLIVVGIAMMTGYLGRLMQALS